MGNPNPDRITDALWWFRTQCLALEPGTEDGGIYAPKWEYHDTRNHIIGAGRNDYSVRYQPDKEGPGDKAAAFDWTFPDAQRGRYTTIIKYGARIRDAFHSRDPRLYGFREVLIQADPDGNAEGFDFLLWSERTPDSSHLWHAHFSILRRHVGDRAVMAAMLSILAGEPLAVWRTGQSRYGPAGTPAVPAGDGVVRVTPPTLRRGSNSRHVTRAQALLRLYGQQLDVDGDFGPATEAAARTWQAANGVAPDGVIGPATWAAMLPPLKTTVRGATGIAVMVLQTLLNVGGSGLAVDGDFGPATDAAVRRFQARWGLDVDGEVGPNTWTALLTW